jgi:hypothetical protein
MITGIDIQFKQENLAQFEFLVFMPEKFIAGEMSLLK